MDKLISAEIPPKSDPVLLSVVKKQMVHSHTEACKEGSKCKKKFPKAFTPFTIMNSDGYPSSREEVPRMVDTLLRSREERRSSRLTTPGLCHTARSCLGHFNATSMLNTAAPSSPSNMSANMS